MSEPNSTEVFLKATLPAFLRGELSLTELAGIGRAEIEQLVRSAIERFRLGQWAEAQQEFQLLSQLMPDSYLSHHYLGLIGRATGDLGQALSALERAAELLEGLAAPTAFESQTLQQVAFLYAETLVRLGKRKEAHTQLLALEELGDRLDPALKAAVQQLASTVRRADDWWG